MKSRIAIFAAILLVPLALAATSAVAQGTFMKAAPSGEQKPVAAPGKDSAAKGQKPKTTTLCAPPGGGPARPC